MNLKYSLFCCIGLPFCNIVMSKPGFKFSLLEDLVLITVERCQIILKDVWFQQQTDIIGQSES